MMAMGGQIKGGNTTFEQSLNYNIVPKISSLSCTSLFSKYIFDIVKNETKEFVDLSLLFSQNRSPFTKQLEKYLTIGLLSSEDGKNHREPLNLVIILDISGSMSSSLSEEPSAPKGGFYGFFRSDPISKSKLDLAKTCVKNLYGKLSKDERIGVVAFNSQSQIILPMTAKKEVNKSEFFQKIDDLEAGGGTIMEVGYKPAIEMLENQISFDSKTKNPELLPRNHRILFITDAIIDSKIEKDLLFTMNQNVSQKPINIFTTFIGVGIDFDTDLVSRLTKVRGSNYFSVHTEPEFKKTLEEDFNYMVTPLCFDVDVKIVSKKYEIERTFGSEYDFQGEEKTDILNEMKKGGVLRVDTLTAYEKTVGGIKGGIVLVKLKEKDEKENENEKENADKIIVTLNYEDLRGEKKVVEKVIDGKIIEKEFFPSSGVRKALLLTQYYQFVKELIEKENKDFVKGNSNELEKQQEFLNYFKTEAKVLEDKLLMEEYENLKKLLNLNKKKKNTRI